MPLIDKSYFFGDITVAQKSDPAVTADLQWFIDEYEPKLMLSLLGYELYRDFKAGLQEDPIPQKWLDLLYGKEYTNSTGKLTKWEGLLQVADTLNPGTYIPDDIEIIITGGLIGGNTYTNTFLSGKSFRVVQRAVGNLGSDVTINDDGFTLNNGFIFNANDRYYIEFTAPVPLPSPATTTAGTAKLSMIANYVYYHYSQAQATSATGTGEKALAAQNAAAANGIDKQVRSWNKLCRSAWSLNDFLSVNSTDYPQHYADYCSDVFSSKNSLGI